jgi:hypothetical protein
MFDITGDDIAALNDEDLRTLVGRLCEAELRRRALPVSAVTWGGNQTAKDGGLDVHVALPTGTQINGFVARPDTGFQVKKPDMPRAEILDEMRPNGVLRPVILELAKASGAYIIVSATGSTSHSALANRRAAMREAVAGIVGADELFVDFYDRNRLATWVRDHPGVIPWLRSTIGRPIQGWRSFGAWSRVPQGKPATYLVDETARITTGQTDEGDGLSATQGLEKMRDLLASPGGLIRLVGLSGVGKTRFAEALFDPTIGAGSLDPALAFYTDLADDPVPPPITVVSSLIAARTRAIVVVDNCPPDTHRQLADAVGEHGTTVSLLTIEYDIREDQPEGTEVFSLSTSSSELIEKLVSSRFPEVSEVDLRTIAEFSGGNARIALALAGTVTKTESVSGLNDAELLRRLFLQRHEPDSSLMAIAQACALVYSFEGETISGEGAELPAISTLAGRSPEDVYRATAELKRRDLLQERGPWRAVLPHAIANRLAATALENIPRETVLSGLLQQGTPRLAQSFSRRLGYLAGSKEARNIAESWLAPGGLLADVGDLNELGRAMFTNVAPLVPDAALAAIEHVLREAGEETVRRCGAFAPMLRSIAYESEHFGRTVSLLVKIGRLQLDERSDRGPVGIFESLFHVILSGTHATPIQRAAVADSLLKSPDALERELGVQALQAMLKTGHFVAPYGFEFGAQSRDFGYHPRTTEEVRNWFATALALAERFGSLDSPIAEQVRTAVATEFRGLWHQDHDGLERVSRAFASTGFWREGWIGARETRIYDGDGLPSEISARLIALEEFLRPKDLVERVRGTVLNAKGHRFDIDDLESVKSNDYAGMMARSTAAAERLGADVVSDESTFETVLSELLAGGGKVIDFGRGVGAAAQDPRATWRTMVARLATTQTTRIDLLGGFLEGLHKRDPALADALLDEALDDPVLARWVPTLQRSTPIDDRALFRLHQTLERDSAPATAFYALAYGRVSDSIPAAALKKLLLAVLDKPEGLPVVLEILSMRFHGDRTDKRPSAPEVIEVAKEFLRRYRFHRTDRQATHEDYGLGTIIRASLCDKEGKPISRRLSRELADGVSAHELSAHDYGDTMGALVAVQPFEVLDELFSGDQQSQRKGIRLLDTLRQFRQSPMDGLSDETIIDWCDRNPAVRYPLAAAIGLLFKRPSEKAPHEWTSLTSKLLSNAPDPVAVFNEIAARLYPRGGWSGSLATKLETRLQLLEQLDLSLPELVSAREAAKAKLQRQIDAERRRELDEHRARGGRFE